MITAPVIRTNLKKTATAANTMRLNPYPNLPDPEKTVPEEIKQCNNTISIKKTKPAVSRELCFSIF